MRDANARYLLDANVLLRQAQHRHPHFKMALAAAQELIGGGDELFIVPQVLYEFWAVATRRVADNGLELTTTQAAGWLMRFRAAYMLLHDTPDVLGQWERLAVSYGMQGKQSHDARLVAAMKAHGLTHLLTFNAKDFRRFTTGEGIGVVNPAKVTQQQT